MKFVLALIIALLPFVAFSAEEETINVESYKNMTLEQMTQDFSGRSAENLAQVVKAIIDSKDLATIDKAGRAFVAFYTSLEDTDTRSNYVDTLYAAIPGIKLENKGVFVPFYYLGNFDLYRNASKAFNINAGPFDPESWIPGGTFDNPDIGEYVPDPEPPKPYSKKTSY